MSGAADRRALVATAAELGAVFAKRAERHDRDASFPYDDFADLREAGFLALCVPAASGGRGASFADYCRVSNELARHAPATALAFNMHCVTMLLAGQIADDLTWTAEERAALDACRRLLYEGVVDAGTLHAQPFSEGNAPGTTEGIATRAEPVDGGYLVTGRKIFASLSEAANIHNIVARVPGDERVRFLGVPAGREGLSIVGEWDPLGMRATLSRTLEFDRVFVPLEHEWLPPGGFDQAATRWPHFFMTLSFTYLGLQRGVLDETQAYLLRSGRAGHPIKQQGWAELQLRYEQARAVQHAAADEAGVDPSPDHLRRAWAAVVTVIDGAADMASLALRVGGGRALLKPEPLERLYRDARCGATMLPWSVEVCLERLGGFGLVGEGPPRMTPDMQLVTTFAEQFAACAVTPGEVAVVLCERASRRELVDTAVAALTQLGARPAVVEVPTPAASSPVPVRSTGASHAVAGHRSAIAACASADFVVDCTVEGLLHAPELGTILADGARVLMISNEHPEVFARVASDKGLADRVRTHLARLRTASTIRVTSPAGTDLTISLAGAVCAGSDGTVTDRGDIAHWPGGLVLAFPAAGSVNGTLVLAPGDVNLTFKEYVRTPIRCTVVADRIESIEGDGFDAELFESYLAAWGEADAYAVSHVGWGLNEACRWESLAMYDKSDTNGTELRAFAGNFLYSTGANEVAGRFAVGHFDLPMRHCTITLDGDPVVTDGAVHPL